MNENIVFHISHETFTNFKNIINEVINELLFTSKSISFELLFTKSSPLKTFPFSFVEFEDFLSSLIYIYLIILIIILIIINYIIISHILKVVNMTILYLKSIIS